MQFSENLFSFIPLFDKCWLGRNCSGAFKKKMSMSDRSSTSSRKPWGSMRLDLTWYSGWGVYASISAWNYSQNSLAAAEASKLKICFHKTSQDSKITNTILINTKMISCAIKKSFHPINSYSHFFSWPKSKVNGNWDSMIRCTQLRKGQRNVDVK